MFGCRTSGEGKWLSKKQALDAIGQDVLQARVMAGTIQPRRSKEDGRLWELKLQTEREAVAITKEVKSRLKSELAAKTEDVFLGAR